MFLDENNDYYLDELMTETISHLVSGHVDTAAEGLNTMARYFARAGLPLSAFMGMRKHLIDSATNTDGCPMFILEKLRDAENILHQKRTGTNKTIIVH